MHENRETSEMPAARKCCRTAGEGHGRTARVYVTEESAEAATSSCAVSWEPTV